ncbi:hypothetical protein L1887_58060 [Cichorium endivia]|nr:hypothetical protein L1887_58060 [Cichorium endivia]
MVSMRREDGNRLKRLILITLLRRQGLAVGTTSVASCLQRCPQGHGDASTPALCLRNAVEQSRLNVVTSCWERRWSVHRALAGEPPLAVRPMTHAWNAEPR